jgi:hypothetical protein
LKALLLGIAKHSGRNLERNNTLQVKGIERRILGMRAQIASKNLQKIFTKLKHPLLPYTEKRDRGLE